MNRPFATAILAGGLIALTAVPVRAETPGEATNLRVTGFDSDTGAISISFQPACAADDHHLEFGPLSAVSTLDYSGQECGLGTGGTHDGFDPGPGSFFFLVVGNDGVGIEGSYGLSYEDGTLAERATDLMDPLCAYVQDLSERCDGPVVPVVQLTAYRPQSELYGVPIQRTPVPEEDELTPGVGVRVNGDDDNGNAVPDGNDSNVAGENDLIEVVLFVTPEKPPAGIEYALRRSDGDLLAWTAPSKQVELFGGGDSVTPVFGAGMLTIWIELPQVGEAVLELVAVSLGDQSVIATDAILAFPFSSVVIALGGESQVPADPPLEPGNHGTFQVALDLYRRGYDVHMYDEDVVTASGAGAAYGEVVSAVRDRGVGSVAIFGYSHGGGSTNDLARRLDDNRGTIGTFSIDFTAYVDGIDNDSDIDIGTETELPPSTGYHANYYQNPGCGFFALCGGPIAGADFDLDVTTTPWGAGLTHFTVDDAPEVTSGIRDQLLPRVPR
jgi:hypothetical protein